MTLQKWTSNEQPAKFASRRIVSKKNVIFEGREFCCFHVLFRCLCESQMPPQKISRSQTCWVNHIVHQCVSIYHLSGRFNLLSKYTNMEVKQHWILSTCPASKLPLRLFEPIDPRHTTTLNNISFASIVVHQWAWIFVVLMVQKSLTSWGKGSLSHYLTRF